MSKKILVIATSADKLSDGKETGCWMEEVAAPYFVFTENGYEVTIASIKGGEIPFDEVQAEGSMAIFGQLAYVLGYGSMHARRFGPFLTKEAEKFVLDGKVSAFACSHQPSPAQPSPAQPSPAQPSPAQPSPAQPSPAQPSPAQPSPAQPSPAQPSPAQPSPAQPSPAQPSPAQPSPAQPSPAQPSPAQPSPAQPSPAQPSPAQPSPAQPSRFFFFYPLPFAISSPSASYCVAEDNCMKLVTESKALADVNVVDYDAVFLPGGHGTVVDFPGSEALAQALASMWEAGKVVSAVCHGPVGLVGVKTASGEALVKGKKVTGFSNSEERAVAKEDVVPFLLEDKLKELGGSYESGADWAPCAVRDGRLVTGQNPGSSAACAKLVVQVLSE
ncbi:hypothetical protein QJQ45_017392 [Haematococcus lacustris]|nr:hypothetical protein QJQ45_017392 [Haematococcus lacustris]